MVNGYGHLVATTSADVLAAKFKLGFQPGGGTIQSITNDMYVTASPGGDTPITAARVTAGSYEVFRWSRQADDTYTLKAMVNRGDVTTTPDGGLINNSNSTNGIPAGRYRIVETEIAPPVNLPATGTLRSVSNTRYVTASAGAPTLVTTAAAPGEASRWRFAVVEESPEATPYFTIQSVETGQYVTGNMDGSIPLSATAPAAQAWEYFQFIAYQGANIVIHVASGNAVAAQADNTLIDNTNSISTATLWEVAA